MAFDSPNVRVPIYRFEETDRVTIDGIHYIPFTWNDQGHVFRREDSSRVCESFTHGQLVELVRAKRLIHDYEYYIHKTFVRRVPSAELKILDLPEKHNFRVRYRNAIATAFIDLYKQKRIKRTDASINENRHLLIAKAAELFPQEGKLASDRVTECPSKFSARTLRNWVSALENFGIAGNVDRLGNCGKWVRPEDQEARKLLLFQLETYLSRGGPTDGAFVRFVRAVFATENAQRAENGLSPLPVPSRHKILAPILALDPFYVLAKREGIEEAVRKFQASGQGIQHLTRPLQRVEMDEVRLDIMSIFKDNGLLGYFSTEELKRLGLDGKKGRWWLTVAMCATTRCIVGMRLSRNPSRQSAKDTLLMVLQDKGQWADAVKAMSPWHQHGWLEGLVTDCGPAFRSFDLRVTCEALGIRLERTVGGHPELRARIERLFRTMGFQLFPYLTGRTFSNVIERKGHDPEKMAALSADDLAFALVRWAVDFYHNQPHDGLSGATPNEAWEAASKTYGVRPVTDIETLAAAFAKPMERTLHRDGIKVFGVRYQSKDLQRLARRRVGKDVQIRWYPGDLGAIWVKIDGWVKVGAALSGFDGVTAQEWIAATENLRTSQRNNQAFSHEVALKAIAAIVAMNSAAKKRANLLTEDLSDELIAKVEQSLFQGFHVHGEPEHTPEADPFDGIGTAVTFTEPVRSPSPAAKPQNLAGRKRGSGTMKLEE